jgi:hypothetical protein
MMALATLPLLLAAMVWYACSLRVRVSRAWTDQYWQACSKQWEAEQVRKIREIGRQIDSHLYGEMLSVPIEVFTDGIHVWQVNPKPGIWRLAGE